MRALLHTEFAALLARAGVSQASFARLTGVTARQVNNWARGRALVTSMGRPARGRASGFLTRSPDDLARGGGIQLARNPRRPAQRRHGGGAAGDDPAGAPLPSGQGRPARADDPHQRRTRKRAAQHVRESVTDPLNSKGTN